MEQTDRASKTPLKIDWVNTLFLTLTPVFMVVFLIAHFQLETFHYGLLILFFVLYVATGLAITGGYHRLISHKAYKANKGVKFLYLVFGAATFQNSALKWATDHRRHHRHVDEDTDPYNISKGFWWAHIGWIFFADESRYLSYPQDLLDDKLVMWQHKYYLPIAISVGFGLPLFIGYLLNAPLGGLAFGALLRIVVVHHCTFFINSLCHFVGSRTYTDKNSARDSMVMALFTFGEGYHNYHHRFQMDYRNGIRWYHFDPTKWLINLLAYFGMAGKLKTVPESEILRARMTMEEKRLKGRINLIPKTFELPNMDKLKIRVEEAQAKFQTLKLEYQRMKHEFPHAGREKFEELKTKIKLAKVEFKIARAQWNAYFRFICSAPHPMA